MEQRFALKDLIFFHEIVYGLIPVNLPDYLTWFEGASRLRSSDLDRKSLVCTLLPRTSSSRPLEKSFFYRSHTSWNILPLELREILKYLALPCSELNSTTTCGNPFSTKRTRVVTSQSKAFTYKFIHILLNSQRSTLHYCYYVLYLLFT
jgi:hypothetical protein